MRKRAAHLPPGIESALLADEELHRAAGKRVEVTNEQLIVELTDGRVIATPLEWYPRLVYATPEERENVEIGVFGLHWPALDEDLSYRGMLLGRRDQSNPRFLKFWLENKKKRRLVTLEDWMKQRRKKSAAIKTRKMS